MNKLKETEKADKKVAVFASRPLIGSTARGNHEPLYLYDSYCKFCGTPQKQTVPDDPENRGICYSCHQAIWGKR